MIPEPWRGAEFAPPWPVPKPPRRLLHLGLLLATVVTTVIAGALQQGVNPLETPKLLYTGIPFSFTLLLILGACTPALHKFARIDWTPVEPYAGPDLRDLVGTTPAPVRSAS